MLTLGENAISFVYAVITVSVAILYTFAFVSLAAMAFNFWMGVINVRRNRHNQRNEKRAGQNVQP